MSQLEKPHNPVSAMKAPSHSRSTPLLSIWMTISETKITIIPASIMIVLPAIRPIMVIM